MKKKLMSPRKAGVVVALTIGMCGLLLALQAFGAEPQRESRTVAWFTRHQSELRAQIDACRNDPGHARGVPDCANATQAQLVLASNEAWARFGMAANNEPMQAAPTRAPTRKVPAEEIHYWRQHEGELLARLRSCRNTASREQFASMACPKIYASAQEIRR